MTVRPCPKCDNTEPRWLEWASFEATVDFYRCQTCGHVWNVDKQDPNGKVTDVTVEPPKQ